jgi:hypothetical protein
MIRRKVAWIYTPIPAYDPIFHAHRIDRLLLF